MDKMQLIVSGEAEVLLSHTSYIPILAEGSFFCEAALLDVPRGKGEVDLSMYHPSGYRWLLQHWNRLPQPALALVEEFLKRRRNAGAQGFPGRVRTTRRSLLAELTRHDLQQVLNQAEDPEALPSLSRSMAGVNIMQNIGSFGAVARQLGHQDVAALRVICEAPVNISCRTVPSALWAASRPPKVNSGSGPGGILFGCCTSPPMQTYDDALHL